MEEYDLKYNGGTVKIKYEPKLKSGPVMRALESTLDIGGLMQGRLKVYPKEWISKIVAETITEAPFDKGKLLELDFDDYREIAEFVADKFPMTSFLTSPLRALLGKGNLDEANLQQQIDSTFKST